MDRTRVVGLIAALCLIDLVLGAFALTRPRATNYGPEDSVRATSGRDVHRHDLLYQWRIARITVAERVLEQMYAYRGGTYCPEGPTDAERLEYTAQRGPSRAERAMLASPAGKPGAISHRGGAYAIYWQRVFGAVIAVNLIGAMLLFGGAKVIDSVHTSRAAPGRCQKCGYDLRASFQFGRCPESVSLSLRRPPKPSGETVPRRHDVRSATSASLYRSRFSDLGIVGMSAGAN